MLQIHLVKSKKKSNPPKIKNRQDILAGDRLYTRGVLGAVLGGGSPGDLGRASLQGGSQEFGGEGRGEAPERSRKRFS